MSCFENIISLEFTTEIEHGVIHLPEDFEEYENAAAHVMLARTPVAGDKPSAEK